VLIRDWEVLYTACHLPGSCLDVKCEKTNKTSCIEK
jgi:hypothetical protein